MGRKYWVRPLTIGEPLTRRLEDAYYKAAENYLRRLDLEGRDNPFHWARISPYRIFATPSNVARYMMFQDAFTIKGTDYSDMTADPSTSTGVRGAAFENSPVGQEVYGLMGKVSEQKEPDEKLRDYYYVLERIKQIYDPRAKKKALNDMLGLMGGGL